MDFLKALDQHSTLGDEEGSLAPHHLSRLHCHCRHPHRLHQEVHPLPASRQATSYLRHTGGRGGWLRILLSICHLSDFAAQCSFLGATFDDNADGIEGFVRATALLSRLPRY